MRATVSFEVYRYRAKKTNDDGYIDDESFNLDFEFVAIPELFGDVERVMAETVKTYLENIDMHALGKGEDNPIGSRVKVVADVIGIELVAEDTLTEDFYKRQKKKEINLESLENDLKYAISIMQSGNTETTVEALNRVRWESQSWVYHMLNKHFDQPIPDAYLPDKPVESTPVDKK